MFPVDVGCQHGILHAFQIKGSFHLLSLFAFIQFACLYYISFCVT